MNLMLCVMLPMQDHQRHRRLIESRSGPGPMHSCAQVCCSLRLAPQYADQITLGHSQISSSLPQTKHCSSKSMLPAVSYAQEHHMSTRLSDGTLWTQTSRFSASHVRIYRPSLVMFSSASWPKLSGVLATKMLPLTVLSPSAATLTKCQTKAAALSTASSLPKYSPRLYVLYPFTVTVFVEMLILLLTPTALGHYELAAPFASLHQFRHRRWLTSITLQPINHVLFG